MSQNSICFLVYYKDSNLFFSERILFNSFSFEMRGRENYIKTDSDYYSKAKSKFVTVQCDYGIRCTPPR